MYPWRNQLDLILPCHSSKTLWGPLPLHNLLSIDPHRGRESSAGFFFFFFNLTRSQRHWHLANPLLICSLRKSNQDIIKRKETSMVPFVKSIFELSLCSKGWWVMGRIIFSGFRISFCRRACNSFFKSETKKNFIYIHKCVLPTCNLLSPLHSSRWPIKHHCSSALR